MGTTSNYSWPYPESTGLVKDGWEDIKDLAVAIDTTVGGLGGAGLVHINTTSFSAVASQSFNDVFSTTYDYYRVIATGTASGDINLQLRLRVSGADNTTASSYRSQRVKAASTSVTGSLTQDSFMFVGSWKGPTGGYNSNVFDILNPFTTDETVMHFSNNYDNNPTELSYFTGNHNQAVSYTGFTLYPSSGDITGKVSIFGYAKA